MPNIPQSTEKIIQKFIDRVNKLLGKRVNYMALMLEEITTKTRI